MLTLWCLPSATVTRTGTSGDCTRHVLARLDVDELEQLETVELPLALAHLAAREDIARLKRQLPADRRSR